jgi:hypothetical protein
MTKPNWRDLTKELEEIEQSGARLRAEWYAYEGAEDYGIWLLRPEGRDTDRLLASFSLFTARAIGKLGVSPISTPDPSEHFPDWSLLRRTEQRLRQPQQKTIDLSNAVPYGLDEVDRDAIDPFTRAWLEWLRRHSAAFRSTEGTLWIKGKRYKSRCGIIEDLCAASAVACKLLARDEIRAQLIKPLGHTTRTVPRVAKRRRHPAPATGAQVKARAATRQAVVNPILVQKGWKRGRLVTESGVGKATVYGYLDGTRARIDINNRKAIADALGLKLGQLPL